jgi:hypothetical protein
MPGENTFPGSTMVLVASGAPGSPRNTRRSERGAIQSGCSASALRVSEERTLCLLEAIDGFPNPAPNRTGSKR